MRADVSTDTLASALPNFLELFRSAERRPGSIAGAPTAIAAVDPEAEERDFLLSCAAASQAFPLVHQGHLIVAGASESTLDLAFADEATASALAADTVLSHLYAPSSIPPQPRPRDPELRLDELCDQALAADDADGALSRLNRRTTAHHLETLDAPPLLDDAAFRDAFGVDRSDWLWLQATLLGMADVLRGCTAAARRSGVRSGRDPGLAYVNAHGGPPDVFRAALARQAGIDPENLSTLLRFLTLDLDELDETGHAAGAYWPPITIADGSVVMSPHLLARFTLERNLIFALSRLDRRRFDRTAATGLERRLLTEVAWLFELGAADVSIHVGRRWRSSGVTGEFDLLMLDSTTREVVHVQAKGSLPAEAESMVALREGRLRYGLDQLKRFRALAEPDRVSIIARITGVDTTQWRMRDVLLSRSGFGSSRIRADAGDVDLITPGPLVLATDDLLSAGRRAGPSQILDVAARIVGEVHDAARPRWAEDSVELGVMTLRVPQLHLDIDELNRWRLRVTRSRAFLNEVAKELVDRTETPSS